ncbi:MAG: T9SS type A sorting domain-containing protein [Bacteroidota bacterium]
MDESAPLTLYAAYGNAWKTEDGGDTWSRLSDCPSMTGAGFPAPASMIVQAPSDDNVLYMSKRIYHQINQPSELWRSIDGGFSWTNLSLSVSLPDSLFFNDLSIDDDDPFHLWLSLGGFVDGVKVFESFDAGDSWQNASGSLPNLPVNTILHQPGSPNNIVYAGLDIGVWYKSDTSDWQMYSQNLPNVIVTELEINPTNEKLYAATFGRGLWQADLVEDQNNVNIEPGLDEMSVSLSPNPNDGYFHLQISDAPQNSLQMEIVDVKGSVLRREQLSLSAGTVAREYQLDLPYGLYYLRLSAGNRSYVEKFLIE